MTDINIVITMAGRGSRFYAAGYKQPKYEIEAHGHSLFSWSLKSLDNFITGNSRLIFVCLQENRSPDYVTRECKRLGYNDVRILDLPEVTDGQATSAYLSKHFWLEGAPVLIYNIDTYVNPRCLNPGQILKGSDGWVPCFQVPGTHWSFIKIGADGWAIDAAEKTRISDHASIGLYWFADTKTYTDAYDEFFSDPNNLVRGERYIAPLYKYLINGGKKVSIVDLPVHDVHVLGTPEELTVFLQKNKSEII
jgi:hypothetical protein